MVGKLKLIIPLKYEIKIISKYETQREVILANVDIANHPRYCIWLLLMMANDIITQRDEASYYYPLLEYKKSFYVFGRFS